VTLSRFINKLLSFILASVILINAAILEKMSDVADKMPVDKMPVDKMTVEKMTEDKMTVDKMT